MLLRLKARDPWWDDGQGARKTRTRKRLIGHSAFAIAVVACGLTAAAWIQVVAPFLEGTLPF
jgi:hypothetical protein